MSREPFPPVYIQTVPGIPQRLLRAVSLAVETQTPMEHIVMDNSNDGAGGDPLGNFLRLLDASENRAFIMLEDDVRLHPQWRPLVHKAIDERPDRLIRFWSPNLSFSQSLTGAQYQGNLCTYFPAGMAYPVRDYLDRKRNDPFTQGYHDLVMGRWLMREGIEFWTYVPSLVEHEAWTSSVKPRRKVTRQSRSWDPARDGSPR